VFREIKDDGVNACLRNSCGVMCYSEVGEESVLI
jgi:hypothetical protein